MGVIKVLICGTWAASNVRVRMPCLQRTNLRMYPLPLLAGPSSYSLEKGKESQEHMRKGSLGPKPAVEASSHLQAVIRTVYL